KLPLSPAYYGGRPYYVGCWCMVGGWSAFWLTVFLWADVAAAFGRSGPIIFVDKVCIDQALDVFRTLYLCRFRSLLVIWGQLLAMGDSSDKELQSALGRELIMTVDILGFLGMCLLIFAVLAHWGRVCHRIRKQVHEVDMRTAACQDEGDRAVVLRALQSLSNRHIFHRTVSEDHELDELAMAELTVKMRSQLENAFVTSLGFNRLPFKYLVASIMPLLGGMLDNLAGDLRMQQLMAHERESPSIADSLRQVAASFAFLVSPLLMGISFFCLGAFVPVILLPRCLHSWTLCLHLIGFVLSFLCWFAAQSSNALVEYMRRQEVVPYWQYVLLAAADVIAVVWLCFLYRPIRRPKGDYTGMVAEPIGSLMDDSLLDDLQLDLATRLVGTEEDYQLGQEVHEISAFITHNWSLNNKLPLSPAYYGGRLYYVGCWCMVGGWSVFWLTLFLWADVAAAFGRSGPIIFVDKVCIDQVNSDRKVQGILAIPAWLACSGTLVAILSDELLVRLWTCFELCTCVALGRTDKIRVEPALLPSASFFVSMFLIMTVDILGFLGMCLLIFAVLAHWGRVCHRIRKQVHEVDIRTAACQDEGDRAVVLRALQSLSNRHIFHRTVSEDHELDELAMAELTVKMRSQLENAFVTSLGFNRLPFKYLVASIMPLLGGMLDNLAGELRMQQLMAHERESPSIADSLRQSSNALVEYMRRQEVVPYWQYVLLAAADVIAVVWLCFLYRPVRRPKGD
ncbi:unnamed protein product, partial [Polarella glacialis]